MARMLDLLLAWVLRRASTRQLIAELRERELANPGGHDLISREQRARCRAEWQETR